MLGSPVCGFGNNLVAEAMRVLVCGGRDYENQNVVFATLDALGSVAAIITGGAKGADALASAWAALRGIPCQVYKADWLQYSNRAGPQRNQRMLQHGKPDLVVGFPGGRGTADMLRRAEKAKVPIRRIYAVPSNTMLSYISVLGEDIPDSGDYRMSPAPWDKDRIGP